MCFKYLINTFIVINSAIRMHLRKVQTIYCPHRFQKGELKTKIPLNVILFLKKIPEEYD